jgi:EXS family
VVREYHLHSKRDNLHERLLSAFANSLYSFWWDVSNDWGLTLLKHRSQLRDRSFSPFHPSSQSLQNSGIPVQLATRKAKLRGLRKTLLLFHSPLPYYGAIFINFLLRLTWSIKLSPHLHRAAEREIGVFILEILEILRRWIWVYFRVEWEIIKSMNTGIRRQDDRSHDSPLEMTITNL